MKKVILLFMTVIIMHPADELRLIKLQKELIEAFFEETPLPAGNVFYPQIPLWIELADFSLSDKAQIVKVELEDFDFSESSIFCPVKITCKKKTISSRLTLVNILHGSFFDFKKDMQKIKQPVKALKVFRLGLVAEQGPHAKSISKSVWCKIK